VQLILHASRQKASGQAKDLDGFSQNIADGMEPVLTPEPIAICFIGRLEIRLPAWSAAASTGVAWGI
jgi:hypothetical protein